MYTLPGTLIETNEGSCEQIISSLFIAGGLVLSQVCTITGLETHTVQNWVKRKFVPPPVDKKYSKRQFCRIVIINMLKDILLIPSITDIISFKNSEHTNYARENKESVPIDESFLYLCFNDIIIKVKDDISAVEDEIRNALIRCDGKISVNKARLYNVLKIMVTAYTAAEQRRKALIYIKEELV